MSLALTTMAVEPKQRVEALVEEVISDSSLFLVEVVVRGRKGSQVVEVYLDSDVALDVEGLARVSREVSFLLETEEVFSGMYHLNVSSPGADRPLLLPRQFPKHVGRTLAVISKGGQGEPTVTTTGTLQTVDEQGIALSLSKGEPHRFSFEEIVEARVVLPW